MREYYSQLLLCCDGRSLASKCPACLLLSIWFIWIVYVEYRTVKNYDTAIIETSIG